MGRASRRELARRLGISEPRMSQVMTGRENLRLRTLANLGWAAGVRFELVGVPLEDRSETPAAADPAPPTWLYEHARVVANRVRRALLANGVRPRRERS